MLQFGADFVAIVGAYYTVLLLRFRSAWGEEFFAAVNRLLGVAERSDLSSYYQGFYIASALRICLFLTALICVLYALFNLYSGRRFIRPRPVAWDIVLANVCALMAIYVYFYLRRNVYHPRSMFGTLIVLNIVYCIWLRAWLDRLLDYARTHWGMDEHRAMMLGHGEEAETVRVLIQEFNPHGIRIVERLAIDPDRPFSDVVRDVEQCVRTHALDMIVCADKQLTIPQIMLLLELSDGLDVSVKVLSDKMDVLLNQAKMPIDLIHGVPLVHFDRPSSAERLMRARHAFSVVVAIVVTTLLLPLMAVVALLIRLTSRGPVFFIQERIGVNRQPFRMYKFRTMHERAAELMAQVEEFNECTAGLFKMRNDPRVTCIGRFLRRYSLDELPQLINVIRGEMTIVGPRPLPRRDFENYYEDWHYGRHAGLPGLTCLWQVSGRSDIDFHNMCILDVYYLRNQSWVLDLEIVLRTIWVVIFAKGAY